MPIISPKIPSGLEELMRGLAKSVIKENPHNIYEFAAEYFENLLKERDGTVDQSYKKFATYKVYRKNKNARSKREKESSYDVNEKLGDDNGLKKDLKPVNYVQQNEFDKKDSDEKSLEEFILPESTPKVQTYVSSDSEITTSIKEEPSMDIEGVPSQNSKDDDIKNMILGKDMEDAALKIQSTFRGYKVRREMKETTKYDANENLNNLHADEQQETSDDNEQQEFVLNEPLRSTVINENDIKENVEQSNDAEIGSEKPFASSDDVVIPDKISDEIFIEQHEILNEIKIISGQQQNDEVENVVDDKQSLEIQNDEDIITERQESEAPSEQQGNHVISEIQGIEIPAEQPESETPSSLHEIITPSEQEVIEDISEKAEIADNINREEIDGAGKIDPLTQRFENDDEPKILEAQSSETKVEELRETFDEFNDEKKLQKHSVAKREIAESQILLENRGIQDNAVNDDVANMVLDEEMEQAALKIQSSFRGHKVRKEMKEIQIEKSESIAEQPLENIIENLNEIQNEQEIFVENVEDSQVKEIQTQEISSENLKEENKIEKVLSMDESQILNTTEIEKEANLELSEKLNEQPGSATITSEVSIEKEAQTNLASNEKTSLNQQEMEQSEMESAAEYSKKFKNSIDEDAKASEPNQDDLIISTSDDQEMNKNISFDDGEQNAILNVLDAIPFEDEFPENGKMPSEREIVVDSGEVDEETYGKIPVVEEVFEKKIVKTLKSSCDDSQIDLNVEESENKMPEIGATLSEDRKSLEDEHIVMEKVPSGEVEYSTLKESMSDHAESIDEVDIKNQDSTDEKSIDGDSFGSRQQSDEKSIETFNTNEILYDQDNAKEEEKLIKKVDDIIEENSSSIRAEHLHEPEIKLENLLGNEISPIELVDEVVNEAATAFAEEIFSVKDLEIEPIPELESKPIKPESQSSDTNIPEADLEIKEPERINLSETKSFSAVGDIEEDAPRDEILTPEEDYSEIPEHSEMPLDNFEPTISMEENISPEPEISEIEEKNDNSEQPLKQQDEDVSDMILDDEMEDAALKIQAAFRGHQVRKENIFKQKSENELSEKEQESRSDIVIDQCSEEIQTNQENEDTEQQDTSADIEEIQESETAMEDEQTVEDARNEEESNDETANELNDNETTEHDEDDPEGTEPVEQVEDEAAQQNDDDDIANMVLDDEMEQAALKIQSTFRGHKTRMEIKNKDEPETAEDKPEDQDPIKDVDDEIANMVLDDEMEQAALKIQSTFRGHQTRKEFKKENEPEDEKIEENPEEEIPKEETKIEEQPQSSSTTEGKTEQQLQDEEDIANIVMDAEMEQTALKIQSAFRGKIRRKAPKDGDESYDSSAGDESDDSVESENQSPIKSDEDPFGNEETIQLNEEQESENVHQSSVDEIDYTNQAAQYSISDDAKYSIDRYESRYESEPLAAAMSSDINLMQGGGIFPEPSAESTSEIKTDNSDEDKEPSRNPSFKSPQYSVETEEPISSNRSIEPVSDEKAIESFDFNANKDTAEAMYYSLKKNEIETQKQLTIDKQLTAECQRTADKLSSIERPLSTEKRSFDEQLEEDDDDVVLGPPPSASKKLKFGMSMDDRLLGSILSQDYSVKSKKDYPDDGFDPLLEATMRNNNFLEKLHEVPSNDEDKDMMNYYDFTDGAGEEDQFDDFYSGNIRQKIMASSISIADSDYFDPTNKTIIDDDTIRTALETIHSTDSESTIASATTRIQAKRNNNASQSMQYASFGNAAIDRSLDEFIQLQELRVDMFEEEHDDYDSPPPRQKESMDEFMDDTYIIDSDKKFIGGGVIDIKLEQKQFLTVDERRRTLHREDAIQRNSTREDEESSKSSNASSEKMLLEKNNATVEKAVAVVQQQDSIIEPIINVEDLTTKPIQINKSSKLSRMTRQHTMPVQIETNVIRVLPKHLRKRIQSAESDKKKRASK